MRLFGWLFGNKPADNRPVGRPQQPKAKTTKPPKKPPKKK